MATFPLTPKQIAALELLGNKLTYFLEKVAPTIQPVDHGYKPAFSNAFGILGARGAGKSTVLTELYLSWRERSANRKPGPADQPGERHYLVPPLDCSVLPPEMAPGTAILLHLLESLRKIPTDHGAPWKKAEKDETLAHVEELSGRYSRTERSYRDLCLEISSSPDDYSHYVTEGLLERFKLGRDLTDKIQKARERLDVDGFVVLLDDFDLVAAAEVRRWLLAMLDELNQPRLLFVLTADFYRLVHLSWDPETGFDDKTGRALLDKLLPPQNRVDLEPWGADLRTGFKPSEQHAKGLWELAPAGVKEPPIRAALTSSLLPYWPRGLRDLYYSLEESYRQQHTRPRPHKRKPEPLSPRRFFELLATCRNEPLLARRLAELDLDRWVEILEFPDKPLPVEDWQELVDAASARPRGDTSNPLPALRALAPMVTRADLGALPSPEQGQPPTLAVSDTLNAISGDPRMRDALRHGRLWVLPLRDAAEDHQPLWAELLIDAGLKNTQRDRARFLSTWRPARHRLEQARFKFLTTREALQQFFSANRDLPRASLHWMMWAGTDPVALQIGWQPLLDGLRGARDPLLSELLADLLIDTGAIRGDVVTPGTAEALDLLPSELWALILLVDALDRCPWSAFSGQLKWRIGTYVGLAVAFVRTAYAYALCQSNVLSEPALSKEQRTLVSMLKRRDPAELLGMNEEALIELLAATLSDPLSELLDRKDTGPLAPAAKVFLESPVYTGVATFVRSQATLAGSASRSD